MTQKVILPKHKGKTLQDQDDIVIWTKFNVVLQAVDELTAEYGHAGDATRQMRIITQEAVRRDLIGISVREREPNDNQLWTWYEVLKQLVEGASQGKWGPVLDAKTGEDLGERQYREVIFELKKRGHTMPSQVVQVEALDMLGELAKATSKKE
jgi:hypothetical protein